MIRIKKILFLLKKMDVECVVCYNNVEQWEMHELPCTHEVCIHCLSQFKLYDARSVILCPICRINVFECVRCVICHNTLYQPCVECNSLLDHEECTLYICPNEKHKFHSHCINEWVRAGKKRGEVKLPYPSCGECLNYIQS